MTQSALHPVLIGAGRVGINLLRHFLARGASVGLVIDIDQSRHARILDIHPSITVCHELPRQLPEETTHVVIAVPDASIRPVAEELASAAPVPGRITAFHCSGVMDTSPLAVLVGTGYRIGGIHPMQSFATDELEPGALSGIGCGIDGGDDFWNDAREFALAMDWRPLRIEGERKALYHAANVFAGNFPTVLADVAARLLRASAADAREAELDHLLPMMRAVLARLEHTVPADALTGPAARGDVRTITRHLDALGPIDPDLKDAYAALTKLATEMRRDK
jgi:predicted short-subunit dehydrogenase-like oxidoreductase (DUF2520 family)